MAEYRLTPAAERDLEAIWIYTFQEWDAAQATRYIQHDDGVRRTGAVAQNSADLRPGYRRRSLFGGC